MRARCPTAEARRAEEGSPRGPCAHQACKPGSVFGGGRREGPGTLRAAKGGERPERGAPEGGQAGAATSSQKAPATHGPQPVRPRSDQGRARSGSACQRSARSYLTGSWGGPGRDIAPGKFASCQQRLPRNSAGRACAEQLRAWRGERGGARSRGGAWLRTQGGTESGRLKIGAGRG